jgi:phosphoglycolate phosphatase-like HAD superfamily hydrolase
MTTIAVGYGYLGDGAPVHDWGADFLVESTQALKALVAPG